MNDVLSTLKSRYQDSPTKEAVHSAFHKLRNIKETNSTIWSERVKPMLKILALLQGVASEHHDVIPRDTQNSELIRNHDFHLRPFVEKGTSRNKHDVRSWIGSSFDSGSTSCSAWMLTMPEQIIGKSLGVSRSVNEPSLLFDAIQHRPPVSLPDIETMHMLHGDEQESKTPANVQLSLPTAKFNEDLIAGAKLAASIQDKGDLSIDDHRKDHSLRTRNMEVSGESKESNQTPFLELALSVGDVIDQSSEHVSKGSHGGEKIRRMCSKVSTRPKHNSNNRNVPQLRLRYEMWTSLLLSIYARRFQNRVPALKGITCRCVPDVVFHTCQELAYNIDWIERCISAGVRRSNHVLHSENIALSSRVDAEICVSLLESCAALVRRCQNQIVQMATRIMYTSDSFVPERLVQDLASPKNVTGLIRSLLTSESIVGVEVLQLLFNRLNQCWLSKELNGPDDTMKNPQMIRPLFMIFKAGMSPLIDRIDHMVNSGSALSLHEASSGMKEDFMPLPSFLLDVSRSGDTSGISSLETALDRSARALRLMKRHALDYYTACSDNTDPVRRLSGTTAGLRPCKLIIPVTIDDAQKNCTQWYSIFVRCRVKVVECVCRDIGCTIEDFLKYKSDSPEKNSPTSDQLSAASSDNSSSLETQSYFSAGNTAFSMGTRISAAGSVRSNRSLSINYSFKHTVDSQILSQNRVPVGVEQASTVSFNRARRRHGFKQRTKVKDIGLETVPEEHEIEHEDAVSTSPSSIQKRRFQRRQRSKPTKTKNERKTESQGTRNPRDDGNVDEVIHTLITHYSHWYNGPLGLGVGATTAYIWGLPVVQACGILTGAVIRSVERVSGQHSENKVMEAGRGEMGEHEDDESLSTKSAFTFAIPPSERIQPGSSVASSASNWMAGSVISSNISDSASPIVCGTELQPLQRGVAQLRLMQSSKFHQKLRKKKKQIQRARAAAAERHAQESLQKMKEHAAKQSEYYRMKRQLEEHRATQADQIRSEKLENSADVNFPWSLVPRSSEVYREARDYLLATHGKRLHRLMNSSSTESTASTNTAIDLATNVLRSLKMSDRLRELLEQPQYSRFETALHSIPKEDTNSVLSISRYFLPEIDSIVANEASVIAGSSDVYDSDNREISETSVETDHLNKSDSFELYSKRQETTVIHNGRSPTVKEDNPVYSLPNLDEMNHGIDESGSTSEISRDTSSQKNSSQPRDMSNVNVKQEIENSPAKSKGSVDDKVRILKGLVGQTDIDLGSLETLESLWHDEYETISPDKSWSLKTLMHEGIVRPIIQRTEFVQETASAMIFHRYSFSEHLAAIRQWFLLGEGHVYTLFLPKLFEMLVPTPQITRSNAENELQLEVERPSCTLDGPIAVQLLESTKRIVCDDGDDPDVDDTFEENLQESLSQAGSRSEESSFMPQNPWKEAQRLRSIEAQRREIRFVGRTENEISNVRHHNEQSISERFFYVTNREVNLTDGVDPWDLDLTGNIRAAYDVPSPLREILTPSVMEAYSRIHAVLLQLKRCQFELQRLWTLLKVMRFYASSKKSQIRETMLKQAMILNTVQRESNHIIDSVLQFLSEQLLTGGWNDLFERIISGAPDILKLRQLQEQHAQQMLHWCLLVPHDISDEQNSAIKQGEISSDIAGNGGVGRYSQAYGYLRKFMDTSVCMCKAVHHHKPWEPIPNNTMDEIHSHHKILQSISRAWVRSLHRVHASDVARVGGMSPASVLLLKLDFNNFYANQSQQ